MDVVKRVCAPWTPDQVSAIMRWQSAGTVHEYTCPNGHGTLGVRLRYLVCTGCGYTQDWVHEQTIGEGSLLRPAETTLAQFVQAEEAVMGYSRVAGETRNDAYRMVEAERDRQVAKGYTEAHDDAHHIADFAAEIEARRVWITNATDKVPLAQFREAYAQIAALAVAALESIERRPGGRS